MLTLIKKHKIVSFLSGLLMLFFLFLFVLQFFNLGKVARGVTVAGQNFGGLTFQETKDKAAQLIQETEKQPTELKYQENQWSFLPQDIGVNFDAEQTALCAFSIGRNKNPLAGMLEQAKSVLLGSRIELSYWQDQQKFQTFTKNIFSDFETTAKNAKLIYDPQTDDFLFAPGETGEIFDRYDLKNQTNKSLSSLDKKQIEIKKIIQAPSLNEDKNDYAKIQAKKILALAPYKLKNNNETWTIQKETLLEWLDFVPVLNKNDQTMAAVISQSAVKDYLLELTPVINREPVNASLSLEEGKVVTFSLSQEGIALKTDESAVRINQEILAGKNEIELIVQKTEPKITTESIDTIGLTSLLAQGVSDFTGSPKNRVHNIGIGAAKINGVLLEPDQEFSFNELIGEIGAAEGYLPELVIKNNKTIPEYGGGLCQVSTTLFRAAVNAGLKITERYPHAFPVKYYNPQGFDATIYPPHPDLRFLNDTPNNILIQSKNSGTKITFEIYGTKDDREVKIIGPTILESNPDGSMKTILYQEIWRNGALERKSTFSSNYKSPALYPVERNPLE